MPEKILLIRPENVYHYNNYPPLNLISLGTALKQKGFDIIIINSFMEKNIIDIIEKELPGTILIGLTMLTAEIPDALKIIKAIKEKFDIPLVTGGWHCTLFPEQTAQNKYIDYVVAGDGEGYIVDIADSLRKGKRIPPQVFYKEIVNINDLPLPDYSLDSAIDFFLRGELLDQFSRFVEGPIRWLPYESSRGCPSQCTFCINVVTNNTQYRKKSSEKVINEIKEIITKYNITHLKIVDDNFFVDIKRVWEICDGILRLGLKFTWDAECRCDYFNDRMLNDDLLHILKKAGLVQLTLGIESGSQHTLDLMKKNITLEQAEYAVKKCNEFKIVARSSFMIEVPGETFEDMKKTIYFINSLRKYSYFSCGITSFRPYPKCELSEKLLAAGYLKEPETLEEWANKEVIDLYTATEYIRPWQINGAYSEKMCYYINMESGARLGNHQIHKTSERLKNTIFRLLARIRNRFMFYHFPFDMLLYKKFLTHFYRSKQKKEQEKANQTIS